MGKEGHCPDYSHGTQAERAAAILNVASHHVKRKGPCPGTFKYVLLLLTIHLLEPVPRPHPNKSGHWSVVLPYAGKGSTRKSWQITLTLEKNSITKCLLYTSCVISLLLSNPHNKILYCLPLTFWQEIWYLDRSSNLSKNIQNLITHPI